MLRPKASSKTPLVYCYHSTINKSRVFCKRLAIALSSTRLVHRCSVFRRIILYCTLSRNLLGTAEIPHGRCQRHKAIPGNRMPGITTCQRHTWPTQIFGRPRTRISDEQDIVSGGACPIGVLGVHNQQYTHRKHEFTERRSELLLPV